MSPDHLGHLNTFVVHHFHRLRFFEKRPTVEDPSPNSLIAELLWNFHSPINGYVEQPVHSEIPNDPQSDGSLYNLPFAPPVLFYPTGRISAGALLGNARLYCRNGHVVDVLNQYITFDEEGFLTGERCD